ncbi:MAG: glycosyltransferase, partial [Alphaproteobacteria bacterium]|nr:glycosyltransferase [Alphaproteobacteria bacterium]
MKVGYFTNQYPAVSHTFIRREILALEELGVEIVRYALRPLSDGLTDPQDLNELERTRYILRAGAGVFVRCLVRTLLTQPLDVARTFGLAAKMGWKSDSGLLKHLFYVIEAMVLAAWCRRDRVQHLHAHFGTNSAAIAMFARIFSGIPYSFTAHGSEEFEKATVLSLDEKLRHAAFAVCVSSFGRSQLMRWVPSELWGKIRLVRCGVDRQFLTDDRLPPVEAPRLVCVGRLCVHKAQPILVAAAERLRDAGVVFEIVLVGDGPMRAEVEAAIGRAGLEDRITITGWVDSARVRNEVSAARALVLPSISENLPVVIMEAMALGRPVVSTYVAGIPELVRPGETGWLVPASDVEALADALAEALAAPIKTIAAMGTMARERVAARHDVMREAARLK